MQSPSSHIMVFTTLLVLIYSVTCGIAHARVTGVPPDTVTEVPHLSSLPTYNVQKVSANEVNVDGFLTDDAW